MSIRLAHGLLRKNVEKITLGFLATIMVAGMVFAGFMQRNTDEAQAAIIPNWLNTVDGNSARAWINAQKIFVQEIGSESFCDVNGVPTTSTWGSAPSGCTTTPQNRVVFQYGFGGGTTANANFNAFTQNRFLGSKVFLIATVYQDALNDIKSQASTDALTDIQPYRSTYNGQQVMLFNNTNNSDTTSNNWAREFPASSANLIPDAQEINVFTVINPDNNVPGWQTVFSAEGKSLNPSNGDLLGGQPQYDRLPFAIQVDTQNKRIGFTYLNGKGNAQAEPGYAVNFPELGLYPIILQVKSQKAFGSIPEFFVNGTQIFDATGYSGQSVGKTCQNAGHQSVNPGLCSDGLGGLQTEFERMDNEYVIGRSQVEWRCSSFAFNNSRCYSQLHFFKGWIGDIVVMNRNIPNQIDNEKMLSYLSIKYGLGFTGTVRNSGGDSLMDSENSFSNLGFIYKDSGYGLDITQGNAVLKAGETMTDGALVRVNGGGGSWTGGGRFQFRSSVSYSEYAGTAGAVRISFTDPQTVGNGYDFAQVGLYDVTNEQSPVLLDAGTVVNATTRSYDFDVDSGTPLALGILCPGNEINSGGYSCAANDTAPARITSQAFGTTVNSVVNGTLTPYDPESGIDWTTVNFYDTGTGEGSYSRTNATSGFSYTPPSGRTGEFVKGYSVRDAGGLFQGGIGVGPLRFTVCPTGTTFSNSMCNGAGAQVRLENTNYDISSLGDAERNFRVSAINDTNLNRTWDYSSIDLEPNTPGQQLTTQQSGVYFQVVGFSHIRAFTRPDVTLNLNDTRTLSWTMKRLDGTQGNTATMTFTVTSNSGYFPERFINPFSYSEFDLVTMPEITNTTNPSTIDVSTADWSWDSDTNTRVQFPNTNGYYFQTRQSYLFENNETPWIASPARHVGTFVSIPVRNANTGAQVGTATVSGSTVTVQMNSNTPNGIYPVLLGRGFLSIANTIANDPRGSTGGMQGAIYVRVNQPIIPTPVLDQVALPQLTSGTVITSSQISGTCDGCTIDWNTLGFFNGASNPTLTTVVQSGKGTFSVNRTNRTVSFTRENAFVQGLADTQVSVATSTGRMSAPLQLFADINFTCSPGFELDGSICKKTITDANIGNCTPAPGSVAAPTTINCLFPLTGDTQGNGYIIPRSGLSGQPRTMRANLADSVPSVVTTNFDDSDDCTVSGSNLICNSIKTVVTAPKILTAGSKVIMIQFVGLTWSAASKGTVNLTIPDTVAPTITSQSASTTIGQTIIINTLTGAQDNVGGSGINPASIIVQNPSVANAFTVITTGIDAGKVQFVAPVTPGSYTAIYRLSDLTGNQSSAQTITVTVNNLVCNSGYEVDGIVCKKTIDDVNIASCTPANASITQPNTFDCTFALSGDVTGNGYIIPQSGLLGNPRVIRAALADSVGTASSTLYDVSNDCTVLGNTMTCNSIRTTVTAPVTFSQGSKVIMIQYPGVKLSSSSRGSIQVNAASGSDTTNPVVSSLNASPNPLTTSGTVILTATATDNVAVTRVDFYEGSTKLSEDFTAPYQHTTPAFTSAENGTRNYTARAFDAAGNMGQSASPTVLTINISAPTDTQSPTVSLSANPTQITNTTATSTLTANANDNIGVARVDFYQGSTLLGSDSTSPYTWVVGPFASTENGEKLYTARAFDAAGNATLSNPATSITVAINASTIVLTAKPTDSATTTTNGVVTIPTSGSTTGTLPNGVTATIDLDPTVAGIQTTKSVSGGVFSVNSNNQVVFTPNSGFNGIAQVDYVWVNSSTGSVLSNPTKASALVAPGADQNDLNGNGVADLIEKLGPNDGDTNSDAIPDYMQKNMISAQTVGTTPLRYSVELTGGQPSTCTAFTQTSTNAESAQITQDSNYSYPYGITTFVIPSCTQATVTFTWYVDSDQTDYVVRKLLQTTPGSASTFQYQNLSATISKPTKFGIRTIQAVYTLRDNEIGDISSTASIIIDPVGLGSATTTTSSSVSIPGLVRTGAIEGTILGFIFLVVTGAGIWYLSVRRPNLKGVGK